MKYYTPIRCPSCGLMQFSKMQRPDLGNNASSYPESMFEIKWGKCDACGEPIPIPRDHIVKE